MNLKDSQTLKNLMRGFAGESQARNRYLFAATQAEQENLQVIQHIFQYTAEQERAHARLYYDYLKPFSPSHIAVDGAYPVDLYDTTLEQLRAAYNNESHEFEEEYSGFAKIAADEGFPDIAYIFKSVATIEKTHADRFKILGDLLEAGKLFKADQEVEWICLNCGHPHKAVGAPTKCPVCKHPQGFFVRSELSPYSIKNMLNN